MKKILFTSLTALAPLLSAGCHTATSKSETQPDNSIKTPPERRSGNYTEPPVEPATKNPTAQPKKKKRT